MLITISNPAFGKNLLALRQRYSLSRKALGKLLGITVYTLKKWEDGQLTPMVEQGFLQRLSAIFPQEADAAVNEAAIP